MSKKTREIIEKGSKIFEAGRKFLEAFKKDRSVWLERVKNDLESIERAVKILAFEYERTTITLDMTN